MFLRQESFLALQNHNNTLAIAASLTSSAWSKVKAANSRTSSSTSCKLWWERGKGDHQELISTGDCCHKPQTITNSWNDMGHGDDENDSESMKRFHQCICCFAHIGTFSLHLFTTPHRHTCSSQSSSALPTALANWGSNVPVQSMHSVPRCM